MLPERGGKGWAESPPMCSMEKVMMLIAALVVFVFTLAGTADTTLYTQHVPEFGDFRLSLWNQRQCPTTVGGCLRTSLPLSGWCSAKSSMFRAMQAFSILSVLVSLLLLLAALLKAVTVRPSSSAYNCGFLGVLAVSWVFVLIEWALMAGAFHRTMCGSPSLAALQYQYSASFALFLLSWLILTFATGYFMFLRTV